MILYTSVPLGRANIDMYSLIFELVRRGHRVIAFFKRDEFEAKQINIKNLKLLPIFPSKIVDWVLLYPAILLKVLVGLIRENPNIIISSKTLVLPILLIIKFLLKRPCAIIFRESLAENLLYQSRDIIPQILGRLLYTIEYKILKILKCPIFAIDEGLYSLLKKSYKIKPILIRYPIMRELYDENREELVNEANRSSELILLYHGRISEERNIEKMLNSFCKLTSMYSLDIKFIVAGYGNWELINKYLINLPSKCRDKIFLLNKWLKWKELLKILHKSHICIETHWRKFPENIQLGTKTIDGILTNNIIFLPSDPYYRYFQLFLKRKAGISPIILYNDKKDFEEKLKNVINNLIYLGRLMKNKNNILKRTLKYFSSRHAIIKIIKNIWHQ